MTVSVAKKVKLDILQIEMLKHGTKYAVTGKCCFYTKTSWLAVEAET